MNIHEIKDMANAGRYTINIDKEVPILPDNYVFNDKKSVTFNRAMVDKHNRIMQKKREQLLSKQEEMNSLFIEDVCRAFMSEFGISHDKALQCHKWALEKSGNTTLGSDKYFEKLDDAWQLLAGVLG